MREFEGVLITTDLDGTLLGDDKAVSKENLDAIEYFKENGGKFTFITGRPIVIVGELYNTLKPNAPIGCFNGGGIYDMHKGEYLYMAQLPHEALNLVEHVDKVFPEMSIQVCGFKDSYFCKMNSSMIKHLKTEGFPDIRCHYREIEEPIAKVLFADENEENIFKLRDILSSHPEAYKYDFIRSAAEYYEILPKGISKGFVITKLSEILGIDKLKTIAIGDNDNDVSMIESAAVGVAVSNASKAAKEAADIITVSNNENALAKIINDLHTGKILV